MPLLKMDTRGYWAVDGTPIYVPTGVKFEHDNIVTPDSGRMEAGNMRITWVRGDVRKIIMSYETLTGNEAEFLIGMVQGKVFDFRYYDAGVKTMRGYVGKCDLEQKNLSVYPDEGGLCKSLKFDIVEI